MPLCSVTHSGDITLHPSLPVTEDSPLAPPGIYGASKQLLEQLAEHYCRWYGMSIAGFRLSRIIYDNEAGRAKLKQVVEDDGWGSDCLWAYVDARDVASACLAWIESDVEGSHVYATATAALVLPSAESQSQRDRCRAQVQHWR